MNGMTRAYIGIGSNLQEPMAQVRAGIAALCHLPESSMVQCSSFYRSAPIGVVPQPDFINAVCAIDTRLTPQALLQHLLAIEFAHGRARGPIHGGPRTLDLDLLLYNDLELQAPEVTIPHPRLHERAFVLYPLLEIAPALRVPGRGSVAQLVECCEEQAIVRLPDGVVRQETIS